MTSGPPGWWMRIADDIEFPSVDWSRPRRYDGRRCVADGSRAERALASIAHVAHAVSARYVANPRMVSSSEPVKCTRASTAAIARRPDCSSWTTSAEYVENVVRPPRNPVIANSRHSGAIDALPAKYAT